MNIIKQSLLLLVLCSAWSAMTAHASKEVHQHNSLDIGDKPIPKIQMHVERDPLDGVNVLISIENYRLNSPLVAAETAGNPAAILQGHAHVFVNGKKRQRLYGQALHIPQEWLSKGVNQIAISLNSHQHENWMSDDKPIVSSVFINLALEKIVLHHYTTQPLTTARHHH